ncbi:MAG: Asp/Glu racemase [Paracoccaceae bacterium]|nr:Asp/Glu racemase [Paracoccaceae bacterium]
MRFDYATEPAEEKRIGLIVLQTDESLERDMRTLLPASVNLMVSRIPSGLEVTKSTLAQMEADLPAAAALLPQAQPYAAIGYGCTSGSAVIGPARVRTLVEGAAPVAQVTNPVTALLAACEALGIKRLAILSPYVEAVSKQLRDVLAEEGIASPTFGSFEEAEEEKVVRIAPASITAAATELAGQAEVDAVFLSCTNLRTLDVITPLEETLGLPVLSSNLVLGWHLMRLAGVTPRTGAPGRLMAI